ncbi:hypothetical protein ACQKEY_07160 [Lysinibacillus fusiformis]|uniref:hypothetical protein n=1 Tax=Lysinibacillus fusiformis TaxID=28031 RepID=UPI003D03F3C8
MDIQKMMDEALVELHKEGTFKEIIKKQVTLTVENSVKDMMGPWSPLSKALEAELKEKLQINLAKLDIPSYNELLAQAIKKQLDDAIYTKGLVDFNKRVGEIVGSGMPEEIKLSELVLKMAKEIDELDDLSIDDYVEMTLIVEKSSYVNDSYHIYMDPHEDKQSYDCKYRLYISEGKLSNVTVNAKEKYSADRYYSKVSPRIIMEGKMSYLEEELFKAYVHGIPIFVDEDQCEKEIAVSNISENY